MQKDGASIGEEDVSAILQRYSPTSILALLQEVGQVQDVKIDWNALVKQTRTGITNPREYQLLWRHLAYSDPLLDKSEADAEPVDDDSDLECELEAFPTVSNEASAEAAAYVKVLMASGSQSDSCIEKGLMIEAPLTINIPRTKSSQQNQQFGSSTNTVNISVPVYVSTQTLPKVSSAEGLELVGCPNNNVPAKRKRKQWSAEEDRELFGAVQRFGEGNWANMLKADFRSDRTPSQLSQRWNVIKKSERYSIMKTGSQLSEAQLAARRAINMALDRPKPPSTIGSANPGNISVIADPMNNYDGAPKRVFPFTSRPLGSGPNAVKAAAVAAGARIATQSAAAAILKQQLKSAAIHIKTRPPPVPHMGSRARLSPKGPLHPNPNVGQRITGQDINVSASSSPEQPILQDKLAGLGLKDQDQQGQPSASSNSPNKNLESQVQ